MIVEWIVGVATGLWSWLGSLLPQWQLPPELADPQGALAAIFALGQGLGPFVDWTFCAAVGAIPLGVWVAGVLWKLFRMFLSHVPWFGGNG